VRTPIPDDVAARVLHEHERTCCVCTIRGRTVQIHHIDDNNSNHDFENLAVLCFECHNETQIRGGFGRKLGETEVRLARADWLRRVTERRARVDDILVNMQVGISFSDPKDERRLPWIKPSDQELLLFVNRIPEIVGEAEARAASAIESGITIEMIEGTLSIIEVIRAVITRLADWYPPRHFGNKSADAYFEELEASWFALNWSLYDRNEVGSGGSLIRVIVPGTVLNQMKELLEVMVEALVMHEPDIDLSDWRKRLRDGSAPHGG